MNSFIRWYEKRAYQLPAGDFTNLRVDKAAREKTDTEACTPQVCTLDHRDM